MGQRARKTLRCARVECVRAGFCERSDWRVCGEYYVTETESYRTPSASHNTAASCCTILCVVARGAAPGQSRTLRLRRARACPRHDPRGARGVRVRACPLTVSVVLLVSCRSPKILRG